MPEEEPYNIEHLDNNEKKQIHELIKRLASEERIVIDEHAYKDNRAYDRWGINHPDSIHKIEKGLKAALGVAPRGQASYKRKLSESGKILLLRLPKELRESYPIEKGTQARITPIGAKKAIVEFE